MRSHCPVTNFLHCSQQGSTMLAGCAPHITSSRDAHTQRFDTASSTYNLYLLDAWTTIGRWSGVLLCQKAHLFQRASPQACMLIHPSTSLSASLFAAYHTVCMTCVYLWYAFVCALACAVAHRWQCQPAARILPLVLAWQHAALHSMSVHTMTHYSASCRFGGMVA